jgi:hypothetical protein
LLSIADNAGFDESRPLPPLATPEHGDDTIESEILADRHLLRDEVHRQLAKRIKKHQVQTKRTASDFVRPKVDEVHALRSQVASHDFELTSLQQQNESGKFDGVEF